MDIVLDKSYLHGARKKEVETLCRENNVLMPESLFYEILTTTHEKRTACFRKLPDIENPVVLVPNVGTLLRYEINNKVPCKPVTRVAIDVRYQFNKRLRNGDYVLPQEQVKELNEWKEEVRNDIEGFKERSAIVYHWFPSLAQYRPGQENSEITGAEDAIANDETLIRDIYGEIRHPEFPDSDMIGPDWTFFRWVQVHFLSAVEYIRRFGPDNTSAKMKSIENDFLDIQYCITAAQVGALASMDRKMIDMFKKVCPERVLVRKR